MSTKKRHTELQALENYRLVFVNLSEVANIEAEMAAYGYDEAEINKGKALYEKAQALYDKRHSESAEEKFAYDKFYQAFDKVRKQYQRDRKKSKVALLKNEALYEPFHLKKSMPQPYLECIQEIKLFYKQVITNVEAKPLLTLFKVTEEHATAQLAEIEKIADLRAKYEKERGESQQATKDKNKAFAAISDWIKDFYIVAEIALEAHPQLLESIGKFVRS